MQDTYTPPGTEHPVAYCERKAREALKLAVLPEYHAQAVLWQRRAAALRARTTRPTTTEK